MNEATSERERGAGTILVLGIVAALLSLTILAVAAAGIFLSNQRLARAADAAALAAADTLSGRISGYPCENADRIAELASAGLDHCDISGPIAFVSLIKREAGMTLRAQARAGPADLSGTLIPSISSSWHKLSAEPFSVRRRCNRLCDVEGVFPTSVLGRLSAVNDRARDTIHFTGLRWL